MVIGLTGGIGSGKSTVARALEEQGCFVFYSDMEAKRIIMEDLDVRQALVKLLGSGIYEDGRYRSDLVAQQVFSDAGMLKQLNDIVHPAVRRELEHLIACLPPARVIVIESAILFESGLNELCDHVVAVTAPQEIRLQRVMQRDLTSREKVLQRIQAQMTDAELTRRADLVLHNDGSLSVTYLAKQITTRVSQAWLTHKNNAL